jgi:hypothetical protein
VDRQAQFLQGDASRSRRLEYIEPTFGMLHLEMAVLGLIYSTHMGRASDAFSLSKFVQELDWNHHKLWNASDKKLKDFNTAFDFFNIVLDGCILAASSTFFECDSTADFENILKTERHEHLQEAIEKLSYYLSNFVLVSGMRSKQIGRDIANENMLLFIQQGLMLRHFHLAMRQGDSGRMLNSLIYFTVWFQATTNYNYARVSLRLFANIRGKVWSPRLRKFNMNTMVVNLTGKLRGFQALDEINEYFVREVKDMISDNLTPATDDHLRNTLSLLIMILWEVRKKMAEQMEVRIDDYHSSRSDPWTDVARVARTILNDRLCKRSDTRNTDDRCTQDFYHEGTNKLAMITPIEKLKDRLRGVEVDQDSDEENDIDAECLGYEPMSDDED